MSGLMTDTAPLRVAGGAVPLTAVAPESAVRGGIVLLHEARSFPESLLNFMEALADDGWLVAAPHLFHRTPDDSDVEVFGDALFEDFDASFDWLIGRGVPTDRVGVIGFDDAGTAAALVATDRPIGAAVSVGAPGIVEPLDDRVPALLDAASSLQAPWLGLYGRSDDTIPAEHVERLRDAVAAASVATLVVSYDGHDHRADNSPVAEADPEAGMDIIVDAQTRIFDWFDSHLR